MEAQSEVRLSENQRDQVWSGLLASETRANYFAEMSRYYQKKQAFLTWLTLFLSSGAFAAAVIQTSFPAWVKALPTALVAAISLYSLIAQSYKKASECEDLHFRYNRLAIDYEALWNDMYSDDAPEKLRALIEKGAEVSKSGVAAGIDYQSKRMNKWLTHVEMHHGATV